MALRCDLCHRKALSGNSRSHSNIKTRTRQGVNLQTKRIGNIRMRLCSSCLKTRMKKKV